MKIKNLEKNIGQKIKDKTDEISVSIFKTLSKTLNNLIFLFGN